MNYSFPGTIFLIYDSLEICNLMTIFRSSIFTSLLFMPLLSLAGPVQPSPKDACVAMDDKSCEPSQVHAFSAIDLNADGEKEIIFAWSGGSCGEQHWVFIRRNETWKQIGNWCGMDGGSYSVLKTKHKGFNDIDTNFGIIRFNGKEYPDTTKK